MHDQKEFNTHLNLSRADVFNATQDEAAYDLTDDDMMFLSFKVGMSVLGGTKWWDAIRAVFDGMMS